jgi:hypothetical protein
MHPSGRPHEFTPDMCAELLNHVAQGASIEQAAHSVGISHRTVQREAKAHDGFQLELERALQAAPVDPERLMQQAARTHWRAAAWMLERAHPERYGKRPPRSCSPEKLRDIVNHIIERALEATPAEHREAVYQHVRPAAEQACAAFLPEQNDSTRWIQSLATQLTPLLDVENDKREGFPSEQDDNVERREHVAHAECALAGTVLSQPTAPPSAPKASGPRPSALPPDGGIMSPKMRFATEPRASETRAINADASGPARPEPATTDPTPTEPTPSEIEANESPEAIGLPKRVTGRKAKALHILTRDQARRARRQASRAKRKGRNAA